MSWHQPDGWAARSTAADPNLPHQIRLVLGRPDNRLKVTCNCGARSRSVRTLAQAWAYYQAHLDRP